MKKISTYLIILFVLSGAVPRLTAQESGSGEPELRLNFRGVPLDLVLDYLSEAAGFTIVLETPVTGTVDAWSNRPITTDEAVDILNSALDKNGYAAIRDGKKLTVVSKEDAKKRNIPVKTGNKPEAIPRNAEMVTQIVPVRYINAAKLTTDLQPLLPATATMTANEGGNALVITDTQENIRRFVEIVAALDTAVSSVSTLEVFPLKFADAKTLATTINDLFKESSSTASNNTGGRGGFPGFGGFGRGGGRGGNEESAANDDNAGLKSATKVTAVADEHSNSLIIAAPDEYMPMVAQLIASVDTAVQDVTEVRVFHLNNADPNEMAELLTNLFPDTTATSAQNSRGTGVQFGGGPFGGGGRGGGQNTTTAESDRAKKQTQVLAVADARTSSVVVSASRDMMDQIAAMVAQLDSSSSKKQKVYVYHLENSDVVEVETILRNLFESQNSRNTQTTQNQNALNTRAQNAAQSQGQNQNSGFGNTGGTGGSQGFR
jgi:type II secretory pathway component GspD/PulD (secretin)